MAVYYIDPNARLKNKLRDKVSKVVRRLGKILDATAPCCRENMTPSQFQKIVDDVAVLEGRIRKLYDAINEL